MEAVFKGLMAYKIAYQLAMQILNISKHFVCKLTYADGECSETNVWLDFALDCSYISKEMHDDLITQYQQVGKLLGYMIENPAKFSNPKT